MQGIDYKDLKKIPEAVDNAMDQMTRNAVHLVNVLKADPYLGQSRKS